MLAGVLKLPGGPPENDTRNPLYWAFRQARLPLRHGGLGTPPASLIRSSAYYGSLSLTLPIILEYFGEIGVPDVLTSPLLGPLMQLNPLTTSVDTETAILALSSDSEAISEKFTACHGTYREHFAAIIEHLKLIPSVMMRRFPKAPESAYRAQFFTSSTRGSTSISF